MLCNTLDCASRNEFAGARVLKFQKRVDDKDTRPDAIFSVQGLPFWLTLNMGLPRFELG